MYIPLSDDKHQMVRDISKKCTGQHGCNSNPVATLPHATVVFRMQPFNYSKLSNATINNRISQCQEIQSKYAVRLS